MLGIHHTAPPSGDAGRPDASEPLPAIATQLVDGLDCAVLAMRYPLTDDFSIALSASFYTSLLGEGQELPRALRIALSHVIPEQPTTDVPPLAAVTPALFGARAEKLRLVCPPGRSSSRANRPTIASLPPQREQFVGRIGPMSRASRALAAHSEVSAVVLYGAAGVGKSAAAVELAHTLEAEFRHIAWHEVTEQDSAAALVSCMVNIGGQIPEMQVDDLTADPRALRRGLDTVRAFMRRERTLIVLDNAELLLTSTGKWSHDHWQLFIDALTAPGGQSRLLVTSRRRPTQIHAALTECLHPLSATEAFLLAREQPHLRALMDSAAGRAGGATSVVARTLAYVQGHPKLLELAEGQAGADLAVLEQRLDDADNASRASATPPDPTLGLGDYNTVIHSWARDIATSLAPDDTIAFEVMCCLEARDRTLDVLASVLAPVRQRAGFAHEVPEDLAVVLSRLVPSALISVERPRTSSATRLYRIHPSVADLGRQLAGTTVAAAVDVEMSELRIRQVKDLLRDEPRATSAAVLDVCRSMVPYLLRRQEWADILRAMQNILERDSSSRTTSVLRPLLAHVVEATADSDLELDAVKGYAATVRENRPLEAASMLLRVAGKAVTGGRHRDAAAVMQDVTNIFISLGRLDDALAQCQVRASYNKAAGQDRLSQISDEGQQLQILLMKGESELVLREVPRLLDEVRSIAGARTDVWSVREALLGLARGAATDTKRWDDALQFNAETKRSQASRRASDLDRARTAFNDYGPLLRTGRVTEARELLIWCRAAFARLHSIEGLGNTMSALANVEFVAGHVDRSTQLEMDALRFKYAYGDPDSVKTSHQHLADYLVRVDTPSAVVLAHATCAAMIRMSGGYGSPLEQISHLARLMTQLGYTTLPFTFTDMCSIVGRVPGVRFGDLFVRLRRDNADGDTALREVVTRIRTFPEEEIFEFPRHVADWDPLISALVATSSSGASSAGPTGADAALDISLHRYAQQEDWRDLVDVLRQIRRGERDIRLPAELHPVHRTIVRRALDAVSGTISLDRELWRELSPTPEQLEQMAEFRALIIAAGLGNADERRELQNLADGLSQYADGVVLGGVLQSILAGERSPSLTDALTDPHDAIVRGALDILAEQDGY